MHRRLGAAETLGVDSSSAMLAKSAAFVEPGLRFEHADIARFEAPHRFDVVFSNAALQWVPDHEALFPRLVALLAPAGQLAVQVPANHDHVSHTAAAEVAQEREFAAALAGHVRRSPVLPVEAYATLLHRLGFRDQHVRLQVYPHVLSSRDEVVEWVKGTLLTDYRRRMTPELYERFLLRYRETLLARLSDERPYFYAFRRVLLWARRHD
jgi:trans-aconitate 2-methyltransferase